MNTIATRIYDFLKAFPPFSMLEREQLFAIATTVDVIYVEPGQYVFKTEEAVKDHFYVVKDGAIGLFRSESNALVDECDEGDIFGMRALLRKGKYKLDAKAIEESVVYSITSELLQEHIATNSEASQFLMASFVTNTRASKLGDTLANTPENLPSGSSFSDLQSADYSKNPVTCSAQTPIKIAAQTMTDKHVGSIIVVEEDKPIGIITDKDLRTRIATGEYEITQAVAEIMSSPVITYPETITVAEAQIAMLKHRITHLCITKDGTSNTELTGVLSEHDIIVLRENNASVLVKEIKRSRSAKDLKQIRQRAQLLMKRYLEQEIPIGFISKIIAAINTAITQRIIEWAIEAQDAEPPVAFAWLAIGSQGRQEQLLLTDQDHALVFEDVSKEDYEEVQAYFLKLADQVSIDLDVVGFEFCPAEMMASNPKWCLSSSEWQQQFHRWITQPDQEKLMLCTIFFDFELIYGSKSLVEQISQGIFESISAHSIFLNYLGVNALQNPPPLSFFRQFLVEQSGEHKDQFDIKARAMMPLVDAARLLILSHNIKSVNNTTDRFVKLAELEPQNKEVYLFCKDAFEDLLRFRTQQGLAHSDSGRFIALKSLTKRDRLKLKRSFKAITAVQELIQTRFKLSQLL